MHGIMAVHVTVGHSGRTRLSFSGDTLNYDKRLCTMKVEIKLRRLVDLNVEEMMVQLVSSRGEYRSHFKVLKHNVGGFSVILIFEHVGLFAFRSNVNDCVFWKLLNASFALSNSTAPNI